MQSLIRGHKISVWVSVQAGRRSGWAPLPVEMSPRHGTGEAPALGRASFPLNVQLCKISIYYFETKENKRKPLEALLFWGFMVMIGAVGSED